MTTPCSMIFVFLAMEMGACYGYILRQAQDDKPGGIEITEIQEIKQEPAT